VSRYEGGKGRDKKKENGNKRVFDRDTLANECEERMFQKLMDLVEEVDRLKR